MLVPREPGREIRRSVAGFLIFVFALSVGLFAAPLYAYNANVSVDALSVRSTMSPLGLGLHTSPYYNNMSHPNVDDRLEEAGVTTLRFGGGGYADILHWSITRPEWENGITGGGRTPWWGQEGNFGGYVGPGSDFGSFVRLLDRTDNSHAVVTVNYGSALKLVDGESLVPDFGGQPKEAAAWVAYANAEANIYGTEDDIQIGLDEQGNNWKTAGYWAKLRGSTESEYQSWAQADGVYEPLNEFLAIDRPEAVGIKYWEIGNETFGTNYYGNNPGYGGYSVDYDLAYGTDRRGNPALSPERYGQEVAAYSQLMKSIDPTIKIGAVLSTPPDDWSWDYYPKAGGPDNPNNKHWNPEVLTQAADDIDFVMVHWYPWAGGSTPNQVGNSLVVHPRNTIESMINGSGDHSGANAGVRDWLSQFGIPDAEIMITEFRYNYPFINNSPILPDEGADAIFVADAYSSWLERGVASVQFLEMMPDKRFLTDSSGLVRGSAFFGVSMVDKLAQPGDQFVATNSNNAELRTHAAIQADGSLAIMLLNLDLDESADVTIDVAGIMLQTSGSQHLLTGGTSLSESMASGLGNLFTVNVPSRSIMTLVIPAVLGLPGDFNDDGVVNAADYSTWRDHLGDGDESALNGNGDGANGVDVGDYALWVDNFGMTLDGGAGGVAGASAAVPEPAAWLLVSIAALGVLVRRGPRRATTCG